MRQHHALSSISGESMRGRILIVANHLLAYIDDEAYRRRVVRQINRGEGRHSVARAVFFGKRDELRQRLQRGAGRSARRAGPRRQCDRALGTRATWMRY